jgi:hypothetical protein
MECFMVIWYISPALEYCAKKNLATLFQPYWLTAEGSFHWLSAHWRLGVSS